MKREEALTKFHEEESGYLNQVKAEFLSDIQENASELADCLQRVFSDIREAVAEKKKEKIMFIHISLLRIDFLNGAYRFLAQAMDMKWYMDQDKAEVAFSLERFFSRFDRAREKLLTDSQKYMGKICKYDIDHMLMETGMECNRLLANLLHFVFRDIEENEDFKAIPKENSWAIRWGEYRDDSEMIASVDREKKQQKDWNRMLRETKEDEGRMVSSFWYETELADTDCTGKAFCFIQFENCTLCSMTFDKSNLIGARFKNCTLTSCSFKESSLRQAGFENCKWENCDFQGADLTSCIFYEDDVPFLHLDAEQLQAILIDRRAQG